MNTNKLLRLALIATIASSPACQRSFGTPGLSLDASRTTTRPASSAAATPAGINDKEYEAYRQQVLQRFLKKEFGWIDQEAGKDRISKERLPGGYWKIRVLYAAMEKPEAGDKASDGAWEDLIKGLAGWAQQQPESVTAKVALATAWQNYAWKARGNGYSDTVSSAAAEAFHKRLATAAQILSEASSLHDRCPHWFVTALWVGMGQGWERADLEKVFEAGIKLEPTYYYLYQAKASYLLPRWGGAEGAWERFADESALNLGGHQGDIVFFAIYSQMLTMYGMSLMNTHQQAVPKLIAGFRSIEKLYGAAPHRLNEACFFAVFSNDLKTTGELFDRIGDDYDESVWHSRQNFEVFRQGFQGKSQGQKQDSARSVLQSQPRKK